MLTKTKIAVAAALVLGSASMAFAEDSSTSFAGINVYGPAAQQQQALTSRAVALPRTHQAPAQVPTQTLDRASQTFDGGAG